MLKKVRQTRTNYLLMKKLARVDLSRYEIYGLLRMQLEDANIEVVLPVRACSDVMGHF